MSKVFKNMRIEIIEDHEQADHIVKNDPDRACKMLLSAKAAMQMLIDDDLHYEVTGESRVHSDQKESFIRVLKSGGWNL